MGGVAESSKLLIMVFPGTRPHSGDIRSPLRVTALDQKTGLYHPGDSKEFRSPVSGKSNIKTKGALIT